MRTSAAEVTGGHGDGQFHLVGRLLEQTVFFCVGQKATFHQNGPAGDMVHQVDRGGNMLGSPLFLGRKDHQHRLLGEEFWWILMRVAFST